ncbi:MAG: hypothetical protein RIE53_05395 [Rhodothermales bacterium]
MMERLMHTLFQPERRETAGEILFFRLFEAIMVGWALWFGWEWGLYIPNIQDVVLPLGLARVVDISFMFDNGLSIANAILMSGAAIAGYARMSRYGYALLIALFHLQYVSRYSLGEISYGSNVVGLTVLALGVAFVAFRQEKEARRFALGIILFFLGFGYTTAAFSKLIASGPFWIDGAHLWMWIQERAVDVLGKSGEYDLNWAQQLILDNRWLGTLILGFGLLAELFGVMLISPRWRPYIMTVLIVMHVGILVTMRINFPANNMILILLAYRWSDGIDWLLRSVRLDQRAIVRRLTSS